MSEMWELPAPHPHQPPDRRYTTSSGTPGAAEDLHAWSIYRQNLNSDFTDSALGTDERSPLPYGNFQLREQTVQSILRHPRLAPRSELGSNMYAYLKFGLPRVFPPNPKSNMTGYDSTEEQQHHQHQHPQQRSRSRATMIEEQNNQNGGSRHVGNGNGPNRARSETDLREGMISNRFKKARPNGGGSENNLLEQRLFKSGSQMSLVSRNSRPPIKGFYTPQSLEDPNGVEAYFKHPHLQVRGLTYENTRRKGRILEGISFDLRGGELLAVMSTTSDEGTALLRIVAGHRHSSDRISGEFLLNGNPVALSRLSSRVGFVRRDYRLHPDITVEQTMKFHAMLKHCAKGQTEEKNDQMKLLLEELGLTAVRHCLVESLTSAERHRLSVACQLQLDTEIIVLDQVTRGMDVFDTFFMVEYLRQWATRRARIVILTIHPPTFEIFSMFTKVTLISTGRTMFYGHRREMLPYFAFIEYPCPGFKNPSDYYLDLVTLDDLSSEALLESSQRIETLADSYRRKQEPLSEPGPPVSLPVKVKSANIFGQIGAIWMYTVFYTFPWNIIRWLILMLISAGISICVGAIYWNIRLSSPDSPQDQNSVNDRFGLQWTMMVLTPWPILLLLLIRDHENSQYIVRDTQDRLYSKAIYFIAKTLIELPFVVTIFLAYIIPSYVMAGIEDSNHFFIFIGYQLLYLYCLRILTLSTLYTFSNEILNSTGAVGILFLLIALPAGYTIHSFDLGEWCKWIKFVSPVAWILRPVIYGEMKNITGLNCKTNPVLYAGQNNIMRRLECGLQNGPHALAQWDLAETYPIWLPILATVGFIVVCLIGGFMGFILRRHAPPIPPPEKP